MIEAVYQNLLNSVIAGIPNFVYSVLTLIIGFIIGKIVAWATKKILVGINIDEWVKEEEVMTFKFSDIITVIAKWIVYLVFIQQAAMILEISAITSFVNSVIGYIPGLVGAAIIIIVGYTIAVYLKDRIIASKTLYADIMGKTIFFLIVYLSIALALPFVGINPELINNILLIIVGSVGIGMAIAIGLGLKDVIAATAKDYVGKFGKKKKR